MIILILFIAAGIVMIGTLVGVVVNARENRQFRRSLASPARRVPGGAGDGTHRATDLGTRPPASTD